MNIVPLSVFYFGLDVGRCLYECADACNPYAWTYEGTDVLVRAYVRTYARMNAGTGAWEYTGMHTMVYRYARTCMCAYALMYLCRSGVCA